MDAEILANTCSELMQVFSQQPAVIEDSAEKVLVVGDVHGDFETITYVQAQLQNYDRVVFVGDYVDRGANSIEVVLALPSLLKTGKVVLLPGNHDADPDTSPKDFPFELGRRFGMDNALGLEAAYTKTFAQAPIAYRNKTHKMIAMHGAIPPNKTEFDLNKWTKYLDGKGMGYHIVWNDFAFGGPTITSMRGVGIYEISDRDTRSFTERNGLELIVRGHQPERSNTIYNLAKGGTIVTVGSASFYAGNRAVFSLPEKKFIRF